MMTTTNKPPFWFWAISVFALLWNISGVYQYLYAAYNQIQILEGMTQAQRTVFEGVPAWATACFALAVFSGTAASLGLVLRKKWAKPLFVISLLTATAQFTHWLFVSEAVAAFGPTTYAMPIMVIVLGIFFIWFTNYSIKKYWI